MAMEQRKLRVLCLHSYRTSASIFKAQMHRSGLDKKLESVVEFVYVDAPHKASGPPPADVAPFFDPPYYQWWDAEVDPVTKERNLEGALHSLKYVQTLLEEKGPFDGFWAFSQGSFLATVVFLMQRGNMLQQRAHMPFFAVMFGGFIRRSSLKNNPVVGKSYQKGKLDKLSIHFIGDRDPGKQFSHDLVEHYTDPIVIQHPQGHTIPQLSSEKLEQLNSFLARMAESKQKLQQSLSDPRSKL